MGQYYDMKEASEWLLMKTCLSLEGDQDRQQIGLYDQTVQKTRTVLLISKIIYK